MTKQEFAALAAEKTILLDGATGSNLRKRGMPVGICTEQWVIDHPQIMMQLQQEYVAAGSDIIYAPTFSANRIGLAMHGLEKEIVLMNQQLVAISKIASQGKALVAGDMTTTGKALEQEGGISYQELYDVYKEQIKILEDAGVDLLVAETMLSVDETMVVLDAASAVTELPVMCTLTLNADGTAIYGGTASEMVEQLQGVGASAVGLNCSVGPDQLEAVVRNMKAVAQVPIIAKPNAGMPFIDDKGEAHYNMNEEEFTKYVKVLISAGADIVGGCCGTTPDYIRQLAAAIQLSR